jgi:hypothetical protein
MEPFFERNLSGQNWPLHEQKHSLRAQDTQLRKWAHAKEFVIAHVWCEQLGVLQQAMLLNGGSTAVSECSFRAAQQNCQKQRWYWPRRMLAQSASCAGEGRGQLARC